MVSSSIVIVLVGVYLMIRLFTNNPLEGAWQYEDGDILLILKNEHQGIVRLQGMEEGTTIDVKHTRKQGRNGSAGQEGIFQGTAGKSDGRHHKYLRLQCGERPADPLGKRVWRSDGVSEAVSGKKKEKQKDLFP